MSIAIADLAAQSSLDAGDIVVLVVALGEDPVRDLDDELAAGIR